MRSEPLSRIADRIVAGKESRKIRVLVGDGIATVGEVLKRRKDTWEIIWGKREEARVKTLRCYPSHDYFVLWWFVKMGLVDVIVTTNYDCHLDATFGPKQKCGCKIAFNPLLDADSFPFARYCSHRHSTKTQLRIWKIHGTLNTAYLPRNRHIMTLPDCPLPQIFQNQMWLYGAVGTTGNLNCRYKHLIDINKQSRECFTLLIESAIEDLTDETATAAILILGFKGYYNKDSPNDPRNEELTPHILRSSRNIPFYIFLTPQQARANPPLYKKAKATSSNNCDPDIHSAMKVLWESVARLPYTALHKEYKRWIVQSRFLDPSAVP
jgi:hypothetical protein